MRDPKNAKAVQALTDRLSKIIREKFGTQRITLTADELAALMIEVTQMVVEIQASPTPVLEKRDHG